MTPALVFRVLDVPEDSEFYGWWVCSLPGNAAYFVGTGPTVEDAYEDWRRWNWRQSGNPRPPDGNGGGPI